MNDRHMAMAPPSEAPGGTQAHDGPLDAAALGLSTDRTVKRFLVHKLALHEVLLTDSRRAGEHSFRVAAELPVVHSFYGDGIGAYHDLMLLTELVRQTGILLAHEYHDIPRGYMFVFQHLDFAVHDLEATRTGERPAPAVLLVETSDLKHRDGALSAYTIGVQIFIEGMEAAGGEASVRFMSPEAYRVFRQRVRAGRPLDPPTAVLPPPAEAQACGKRDGRNVVLSQPVRSRPPASVEAGVRVDRGHPCLFDHSLDHVPGMLLLEAAKQMAVAALADAARPQALVPVACRARFTCFAELELPLTCRATVDGAAAEAGDGDRDTPVTVVLEQPDATVCTSTVRVRVLASARGRTSRPAAVPALG